MTPAQIIRSFEQSESLEDRRAVQNADEPHPANAEPWLSVDTWLVGGSLAIGIVLLAVTLALK